MNNVDRLNLILKIINEYNITAYEIGKYTNISTFAIQKIIKGEFENLMNAL
ncbi:MAG: HTH domain-containing protein [Flavobacteriaceae bacterium]|nr:HTH domain-containing protein [Flavobacteriaceae bacterium]